MKDRLHDHVVNDDVAYPVGVEGPQTLRIALRPLAEFREVVPRLLESRGDPGVEERNRIGDRLTSEVKFLCGSQRSRVRCIGYKETWKHAQQTLLLLGFQLVRGQLTLRNSDIY